METSSKKQRGRKEEHKIVRERLWASARLVRGGKDSGVSWTIKGSERSGQRISWGQTWRNWWMGRMDTSVLWWRDQREPEKILLCAWSKRGELVEGCCGQVQQGRAANGGPMCGVVLCGKIRLEAYNTPIVCWLQDWCVVLQCAAPVCFGRFEWQGLNENSAIHGSDNV